MAAAMAKNLSSLIGICNNINIRYAKICFPKFYSVFGPDFEEPLTDLNEIKKLMKTKSSEELLAKKIKPALSSYSVCSAFYHPDVELLTGYILRKGKRELAKTMVRDGFTKVKHIQIRMYNNEIDEKKKEEILINPLEVFLLAVKNVTPLMWYTKIKKSGSWYKIPVGISQDLARKKAIKWIVESARDSKEKVNFPDRLAREIVAAAQYKGDSLNKKLELHKMCESNRSYVHYWWT